MLIQTVKPEFLDLVSLNRLPVYNREGGLTSAEFPPEVTFIPDFDLLDEPSKLREHLSENPPIVQVKGGDSQFHRLKELGYNEDEFVPIHCLVFPKKIDGKMPLIEKLRYEQVKETFEEKHAPNVVLGDYDVEAFDKITDGFDDSFGVSLICFDKEGKPVCLGTADIRYAATSPFEYDTGSGEGNYVLTGEYVEEYLQQASQIEGLIVKDFEGVADEELVQGDDGNFHLIKGKVEINVGEVPMNSLLNLNAKLIPRIEISQMAKSDFLFGGSLFIATALIKMLENAIKVNNDLIVGFSISPHLLEKINQINQFGSRLALKMYQYKGLDKDECTKRINAFAQGFKIYPANESKVTKIRYKNGNVVYILGTYAAGTFEVPAYFGSHTFN